MSKDKDQHKTPGPKPDRLKLDEDDWEAAVGKALKKDRPPDGWPKPESEPGSEDKTSD